MNACLVVAPPGGIELSKTTRALLAAAKLVVEKRSLTKLVAVVLGGGANRTAQALSSFGVTSVYAFDCAEPVTPVRAGAVVAELAKLEGAIAVVFPASSVGKDCAPRVAALLGFGQASDITEVGDDKLFRRPVFAGDLFADVEVLTPGFVATVRTAAFDPISAPLGPPGSVAELPHSLLNLPDGGLKVIGFDGVKRERPDLGDADVVVSGGRALGSAEAFQSILFPLADALGAAVGASRAAVDAGYAPNDWQVGQTGKVVAPTLYIAVGISGAIQHLAGMKDAKVVVAINKDPDAPIFSVATYGLVGDLFTIVPALTEAVLRAKEGQ